MRRRRKKNDRYTGNCKTFGVTGKRERKKKNKKNVDLKNVIKLVNTKSIKMQSSLSTQFYTSNIEMYKLAEATGIFPNKQFQPKSIYSSPFSGNK